MSKEEASVFLSKMSIFYKIDNLEEMQQEKDKIEYVSVSHLLA